MNGVLIGLSDIYYATLTKDDATGAAYVAPVKVVGAITADINPNATNDTLFADNGPMETASSLGKITLALNIADIPLDVQAVWLGHSLDGATGIMTRKSTDVPPWLALGFKSLKSNGHIRYTWLVKGKFMTPEQKNATKADKITFQSPTVNGSFVKRDYDNIWQLTADEDVTGYVATTGTNWFTAVTINKP